MDLPDAKEGEVIVRFPPEASGYLHIGHAKAALLNQYYQVAFKGKLVFRFDDTNPEKEKEDFEKIILEDVARLQIKPDFHTYTSDHFELMLQKCEEMIKNGKAYVDDTVPDIMKQEREQRIENKNRNNSIEKNLQMWEEMKKGTEYGQKCCVRAKIDMKSDNGCLRDPAMYRCKQMKHPRTGDRYKVYPTYDFACPIVDSIEGVTHTLRTSEYVDRDIQYYWFIDAMNLRKPCIWSYSRLNMTNTVLSKRHLRWIVEQGIVDGWDDPRMPTVRGVLRRGLTVEGLKQFIIAQGSSKSVVVMEWDKIWAFNKKVIDPVASRYNAVYKNQHVKVDIEDALTNSTIEVALHPKNPELGRRNVKISNQILIDQEDAQRIKENENVTFINWGNLLITKIDKTVDGAITRIFAKLNLDNKDFKKTLKITWLSANSHIYANLVYYDHFVYKPVLGKDDDFKDFINKDTKMEVEAFVDETLRNLKQSDIIQIQRKGFFICDSVYDEASIKYAGKPVPLRLLSIPDGSTDLTMFPQIVQEWKKKNLELGNKSVQPKQEPVAKINLQTLHDNIKSTGDLIRQLKSNKASKNEIKAHVDKLLALKTDFKKITGADWSPEFKISQKEQSSENLAEVIEELDATIKAQGDIVRKLKADKADKGLIAENIQKLLSLKEQFKKSFGKNWDPKEQYSTLSTNKSNDVDVDKQIQAQGDRVRKLKAEKASKATLQPEIEQLLRLKQTYKEMTGNDWKPEGQPSSTTMDSQNKSTPEDKVTELNGKITDQGNKVRKLKSDKASKTVIDAEVAILLNLKKEYQALSSKEWKPVTNISPALKANSTSKKTEKKIEEKKQIISTAGDEKGAKKQTRLGIETKKNDNTSNWYTEVITKAELIEYYDVSGCYILRPWSFAIWEAIQSFFDSKIKSIGVQNCYFPMFISKTALETEKTHIADFAPEVAWVTKSGQSELAEPIAIRPTSETVMYPTYAKWVQSHRDLPIKLNQWCSVVRWEFKQPTPFLRTREFLWQEGHTAFATEKEALDEVYQILDFYSQVYEDLLAIPVIKGRKTEKEKFAGGDITTTCEAYVPSNGRGIQGATSHHLGQNFSKMFEIVFEDPIEIGQKRYAYQNSWGLSTRSIGAVVMIHGDDKGIVLPPRVACIQVIIVPCGLSATTPEDTKEHLLEECKNIEDLLNKNGIKCKSDLSDNRTSGWKFNHWELKGVPIRIELGPKDLSKSEYVAVRRDTGLKSTYKLSNIIVKTKELLQDIHLNLYNNAKTQRDSHLIVSHDWNELTLKLDEKFVIMAPFCGGIECEERIKKDSAKEDPAEASGPLMGAKSLCIPLEQPGVITPNMKCIHPACKDLPKFYTLFGRSY